MNASNFLTWAAGRLARLLWSAIGAVSLIATVLLFLAPSYASGLSRWWAVVPIPVFVILALLGDEYGRTRGAARLSAQIVSEQNLRRPESKNYRLVISNPGPVPVTEIEWATSSEPRGWKLLDDGMERPWPALEHGEHISIPVVLTMGVAPQIKISLSGLAGGRSYQRDITLSTFG